MQGSPPSIPKTRESRVIYARDTIEIDDHTDVVNSPPRVAALRDTLAQGDVVIARNVLPVELLLQIRRYLSGVGSSSLPNYQKIEKGCRNFHRVNLWDARSSVPACFHQFSFFPWNQDVFDLFRLAGDIYSMRNQLCGLAPGRFLERDPQAGCAARLSFQFYPKGTGGLDKHVDPYDFYQSTVPIVIMSSKGKDFLEGGAFVERRNGEHLCIDDVADIGDVVYFNSRMPHGVDRIDPQAATDWLSFEGRWMMLAAVNRLEGNAADGMVEPKTATAVPEDY